MKYHGLLLFMVGIISGWLLSLYQQGRHFQEAFQLLKTIELEKSIDQAKRAYSDESPDVGIWELKKLEQSLSEAKTHGYEGVKSLNLQFFLVYARLSKLYDLKGDTNKVKKYYEKAISYYNNDYTNAKIDSIKRMFELLEKFDEIQKLNPKH